MELLGLTFASGWTSGINAYATVLVLGLLGRFAGVADVPAGFQRTDVLVVMGLLALLEFFADKIPYLDSVWDAISTFIRPVAGALIGALLAGAPAATCCRSPWRWAPSGASPPWSAMSVKIGLSAWP